VVAAADILQVNAAVYMGAAMLEGVADPLVLAVVVLAVVVARAVRDARVGFVSNILARIRRMDSKVDYYGYL